MQRTSNERLTGLNAQVRTASQREAILWGLFIVAFTLTMVAAGAAAILILIGGLKVAMASGAAGVLPGCSSQWLKREHAARSKELEGSRNERDEELRLQEGAAFGDEMPPGAQKEKFRADFARKVLSRIPK